MTRNRTASVPIGAMVALPVIGLDLRRGDRPTPLHALGAFARVAAEAGLSR